MEDLKHECGVAMIRLHQEQGMGCDGRLAEICEACRTDPVSTNHVREVYAPFSVEQINQKIIEMLRSDGMQSPVELVYQSIEGLHLACPNHPGDWYFTGRYPTPGGIRMCNAAFVNYFDSAPVY